METVANLESIPSTRKMLTPSAELLSEKAAHRFRLVLIRLFSPNILSYLFLIER